MPAVFQGLIHAASKPDRALAIPQTVALKVLLCLCYMLLIDSVENRRLEGSKIFSGSWSEDHGYEMLQRITQ